VKYAGKREFYKISRGVASLNMLAQGIGFKNQFPRKTFLYHLKSKGKCGNIS
jgi:hypothetical protein